MKTIFLSIISIMLCSTTNVLAQKLERAVVATAGQHNKTSSVQLSSTIGEAAVNFLKVNGISLCQGFQQITIQVSTDVSSEELVRMDVKIFPNPTMNYLNVDIGYNTGEQLSLYICDITGKTLQTIENIGNNEKIDVTTFATGTYVLTLRKGSGETIGQYSVIKSQ